MEIKFITSTGESTQDSDYETAVDIAHYSTDDFKYFFETVNGLKIVLSSYSTTTTMSYLEPDFEEIEEDHKNGTTKDHYAYHSHASNEPANSRQELNMWVELPVEKIVLSVAEMEVYEQYLKNPIDYSITYNELNKKYKPELIQKLNKYDEQQQYNEPNLYPVVMSKPEMQSLYSSLTYNLKKDIFINIDLPNHINEQLISYDQKHLIIEAKNKENESVLSFNKIQADTNIVNNKLYSQSPLVTDILNNEEIKPNIFSSIKKIFK